MRTLAWIAENLAKKARIFDFCGTDALAVRLWDMGFVPGHGNRNVQETIFAGPLVVGCGAIGWPMRDEDMRRIV